MINITPHGSIEVDPVHDASVWGLFYFGAYEASDPRIVATLQATKEALWCRTKVGGMARYTNDYYHQVSSDVANVPGNPWFICTLWYADYLIAIAKDMADLEEAQKILMWVDAHRLPSGVLAEQVHPFTNAPMSVAPLTWSHATYVSTVQAYIEKAEQLEQAGLPRHTSHRKSRELVQRGFAHVHAKIEAPSEIVASEVSEDLAE